MKTQITAGLRSLSPTRCQSLLAITAAWCVGLVILISSAAQAQTIYVSNGSTNTIAEITTNGMLSVFATGLNGPEGLAFDSKGDLFEADYASGNIYEFTNNAGTLSSSPVTFASGLTGCFALAFNGAGTLFVAEISSGSIYEFTNHAGALSTNPVSFVSGQLSAPLSMTFDSNGDLFVGQNNGTIYEFTNHAGTLSSNSLTFVHISIGGNSPVTGLAFDRFGNLFATDSTDNNNLAGYLLEFTNNAGTLSSSYLTFASGLDEPNGLAFDSTGNLFVTDPGENASVNEIYEFTNCVATNRGVFASGLDNPQYIAIAPIIASTPTLTNIIVSPANTYIGVGSNEQFTATGYYSDGSSHTLTNQGTAGSTNWTAVAGLPVAAGGTASVALNGYFYVLGGFPDYNDYFYNPATNVWAAFLSMPAQYAYAGAVGIGTKLYVVGGCASANCSETGTNLYIYDTVTNGWSFGAPLPLARTQVGAGVINGNIYVAGGGSNTADTAQNSLQIYYPASNTWSIGPSMPIAATLCGAAVISNKLYVVGGYNSSNSTLNSLLVYDPAAGSWTNKMSMPTARSGLEAAAVNGLLYAIDGTTVSGPTNLVEVYNPATDTWSTGTPTLTDHAYGQAGVMNGTIYLAGCGPGNSAVTNAEVYTPANSLWSSSLPAVASITTNGLATGVTNGVTTITATSGSISGNATLTVVSTPSISLEPASTTVAPDGSVTFNVSAAGGDLSYQWRFDGTNINGATGASFSVTNANAAAIGVYSVIVSNPSGSVTSSPALLASVGIAMFAGIIVDGPIGSNYLIQSTSSATNTNWTTLTNVALPTQPYIYIDYTSPTNPLQFYRAVPQ